MNPSPIVDPLFLVISREQVESGNPAEMLQTLNGFLKSPEIARSYQERLDIGFSGYDQDSRELFEIIEVRNFVHAMDEQFPYWLFFLSKQFLGLKCILACFLPPFLTEEGMAKHYPPRIEKLLNDRWLPAMNEVSKFAGLADGEIELLAQRSIAYITDGKLPHPKNN